MNLKKLLNGLEYVGNIDDSEIIDITIDSRKVKKDFLFVCINGINVDGHNFYKQALEAGASYIITEKDLKIENQIIVKNSRIAYSLICANFFGNPEKKLKFIGITGTNGKTTTSILIKHILSSLGLKVGLIGTIQYEIGNNVIPSDKTTPDAYVLYSMFSKMLEADCEYVIMEVSSHALSQYRLGNINFDIAIFTNLTQDHLDYHNTMEQYFLDKKKLFDMAKTVVINIDDPYGKRIIEDLTCEVLTYSIKYNKSDFYATNINCHSNGVEFYLINNSISSKINFCMPGIYSVKNALAAAAACIKSGMCIEKVINGLNTCSGVKGRSEIIPTGKDFSVICDYAHTPDGLNNILPAIKEYTKGRLITLFGCGGDRDSKKRPLMGEIASKYSDFVIVTSDNPRTEDPDKIIYDILVGVKKHNVPYKAITDRKEAIFYAIKNAKPNDIIVLVGKGHEDYQVLCHDTVYCDERVIVKEALENI